MKRIPIKVTDHAVLRYLERVMGVDTKAIKAVIADQVHIAETNAGASAVLINGFRYVLADNYVVTVQAKQFKNRRTCGRVKDHPE